tara:strand:+ start:122 stop:502 length:381 start_codon:yes stop_codon:yes gene_type:complete
MAQSNIEKAFQKLKKEKWEKETIKFITNRVIKNKASKEDTKLTEKQHLIIDEYGKLNVYDEISSSYFDELEVKYKNKTIKLARKNNNETSSVDLKKCAKDFPKLYLQLFNNKLIKTSKYKTIKIIK